MILFCYWSNLRWMNRRSRGLTGMENEFLFGASRAVGTGVVLMLIAGVFGHNLFRHNWLWYGGFLVIARHCAARSLDDARRAVTSGGRWAVGSRVVNGSA